MDWSDDVAYSVHDVEDGLHAGHLDPNCCTPSPNGRTIFAVAVGPLRPADAAGDELAAALDRLLDQEWWPHGYDGSAVAQARLKDATSQLIGRFCLAAEAATRAAYGTGRLTRYGAELVVPHETRLECAVLKAVADRYVMQRAEQERLRADQRDRGRRAGRGADRPRPGRPRPAVPRAVRRGPRRPRPHAGDRRPDRRPSPTPRPARCTARTCTASVPQWKARRGTPSDAVRARHAAPPWPDRATHLFRPITLPCGTLALDVAAVITRRNQVVDAHQTFVIVGGGLAGAKAAETLRAEGFTGRVILIGDERDHPYERPPLSKGYLTGQDERDSVFVHEPAWYAGADIELHLGQTAVALDRAAKSRPPGRRRPRPLRQAAARHRRRAAPPGRPRHRPRRRPPPAPARARRPAARRARRARPGERPPGHRGSRAGSASRSPPPRAPTAPRSPSSSRSPRRCTASSAPSWAPSSPTCTASTACASTSGPG